MAGCEVCGKEEDLPFVCNYCDRTFCGEHRLPEAHSCTNLWMVKEKKRREVHGISSKPSLSSKFPRFIPRFAPSPGIGNRTIRQTGISLEAKHLLVAWSALGFAFSIRFILNSSSPFPISLVEGLGVSLLTVGLGFILHELAHKFAAKRYGYWAEFRIWPQGIMMALFFAIISQGLVIFAAPGATYIVPGSSRGGFANTIMTRENGIISLAGPLTNVALSIFVFFPLMLSGVGALSFIGAVGFHINLWLAAFNLIPFGGIDGQKILAWSKPVWLIVAIPLWLFIISRFL